MQTENNGDGRQRIQIRVPDIFSQLIIGELAKIRGLAISVKGRSNTKVDLFCSPEEADALMRDAKPAGHVLYLLQLEAVGKALAAVGEKPTQGLLDMVAQLRSELGELSTLV